jgi:predicted nuclease of restriction endonuclease-like (RecB) superfamily
VEAYWEIGRQIEQAVGDRAKYGKGLLQNISRKLSAEFGKGFTVRNLQAMRQFYDVFSNTHALRAELSWTPYRLLMKIDNAPRREFYLKECVESNWSSRQLERQINSFFYERLLATREEGKETVKNEIQKTDPKTDPDYVLKDPYILEFLNLKENRDYLESELEQALINKLQGFLLELGKGFSFVARQKRITLDGDHFYIDLVFYNILVQKR